MADVSAPPDPTPTEPPAPEPPTSDTPDPPTPTVPPPDTSKSEPPPTSPDPPPPTPTTPQPPPPTDDNDNDSDEPPPPPPATTSKPDDSDGGPGTSTVITVVTRTPTQTRPDGTTPTVSNPADNTDGSSGGIDQGNGGGGGGGLSESGKIAIAVVVPVVAVALLVIAGIWFWKRRKARKDAEEERRKEVEDYAYNPNAGPTVPVVGGLTSDGPYEMRDDTTAGYRGWGSTTAAGSTGHQAPTTHSGGGGHTASYSDTGGGHPQALSTDPMVDGVHSNGSYSPDGEILGAMGPSAGANRGDINRGPSNASSSYSAGAMSEVSDGAGAAAYGNQYYDQYGAAGPYAADGQHPADAANQPVIRDNPARRNTRIENPSHYPQQSAGISQNF